MFLGSQLLFISIFLCQLPSRGGVELIAPLPQVEGRLTNFQGRTTKYFLYTGHPGYPFSQKFLQRELHNPHTNSLRGNLSQNFQKLTQPPQNKDMARFPKVNTEEQHSHSDTKIML